MTAPGPAFDPHAGEHSEERKRYEPPALDQVVRGLFMAVGAALAAAGAARAVRLGVAGLPLVPVLAIASVLLAWAGAIHVGGGEKFDDHPWV